MEGAGPRSSIRHRRSLDQSWNEQHANFIAAYNNEVNYLRERISIKKPKNLPRSYGEKVSQDWRYAINQKFEFGQN